MFVYLTRTKESVAEFAFDLFDDDNNQKLTRTEITKMVKAVYGVDSLQEHVRKIIDGMDEGHDGAISKSEFVHAAKKFPALLFPAFDMQV